VRCTVDFCVYETDFLPVDKIIIAQDSLREFINTLCPGAYVSLTKVDFKALDRLTIKPLGVYGSKQEIVRFLLSINAIDHAMLVHFAR
jgi:hypothetical protein